MKATPLLFILAGMPLGVPVHGAPAAKAKTKSPQVAPPIWKPATNAQRVGAAASIRAQLEAFKRDDWSKAATYQSEGLRRNFGTLAQFRAVIKANYPQFARYKSIVFNQARSRGEVVEMQVRLTGEDGVQLRAIYIMRKEKGIYRVEGVQGGAAEPHSPGEYI